MGVPQGMRNQDLCQGGYSLLGETVYTALRRKEKSEPCRTNSTTPEKLGEDKEVGWLEWDGAGK